MRARFLSTLAFTAFVTLGATAQAQRTAPPGGRPGTPRENVGDRREARRDRLENLTPEQREAAKARAKERFENLPAEQKAWLLAWQAENKSVHEAAKAGTIDRKTAAAQLKAWREANPRPKPATSNARSGGSGL